MTRDKYDCWVIMIVVPIVNMGCERHEEMKYKERKQENIIVLYNKFRVDYIIQDSYKKE